MSGPPGAGTYRVSVKRSTGVGSRYFHDSIRAGDLLQVSAPRGSFTLASRRQSPLSCSVRVSGRRRFSRCFIRLRHATDSSREVWWCYGARNGREHPFAAEARALLKGLPHSHAFVAYSKPEDADRYGQDYDASGHLNLSLTATSFKCQKKRTFISADQLTFLSDLTAELKSWGVPGSRIHSETFGAESSITPGIANTASVPPHPPSGSVGDGPMISFTRSGLTVPWSSRYGSLLELRRGLRRSGQMGLSDWRLPHVRVWLDRRRDRLHTRAT